jgi:putative zinc finger/helix-turn-helix YgiT family protein
MKGFCPHCEKETELLHIQEPEEIEVRGEKISVQGDYFRCTTCGSEFDNPDETHDPLDLAYREYRSQKGMVQPEQILDFRKKYGLTQKELSCLLGFGEVTIHRYENGALQDEAHDRLLKLTMNPDNLLQIIQHNQHLLPEKKYKDLITRLHSETVLSQYLQQLQKNEIHKEFTGNQTLDLVKVIQLIKFFSYKSQVVKSKLLKLLFYADFKFFKEFKLSITGLPYARLPYGPVPDQYNLLINSVTEYDSTIYLEAKPVGDFVGEMITSQTPPDLAFFSSDEFKVITFIHSYFEPFTARQIEEYSHEEEGYRKTSQGKLISYRHAKELRI